MFISLSRRQRLHPQIPSMRFTSSSVSLANSFSRRFCGERAAVLPDEHDQVLDEAVGHLDEFRDAALRFILTAQEFDLSRQVVVDRPRNAAIEEFCAQGYAATTFTPAWSKSRATPSSRLILFARKFHL